MISAVRYRFYQNYLMGSRLSKFRELLLLLKSNGYQFITVQELADRLKGGVPLPQHTAIIRCDIDSDVQTALDMFRAAQEIGAVATWYWRLSTLDKAGLAEIERSDHENGYHFEEVATFAKRNGLRNSSDVQLHLQDIQEEFSNNLENLYLSAAGKMPKTVASHGDFANRFLGETNSILIDETIRTKYGIIAEAYDDWLNKPVTRRFSDTGPPHWWKPSSPLVSPPEEADVFYALVHPRQFKSRWIENTAIDIERGWQGITYALARRR